jgi:hypothetical protein
VGIETPILAIPLSSFVPVAKRDVATSNTIMSTLIHFFIYDSFFLDYSSDMHELWRVYVVLKQGLQAKYIISCVVPGHVHVS